MKNLSKVILFLFIFKLSIAQTFAAGGLMVTPTRLEFKPGTTSQEIKLINRSNETVSYRVSLQHLKMNENGVYQEISAEEEKTTNEKFADNLLRFSPKTVTLKPNEVQTLRMMSKSFSGVATGEYRTHVLFREEPSAEFNKANNVEPAKASKDGKISVVLKPLFGISIPVIVTVGKVESKIEIQNLAVVSEKGNSDKKLLSMDLNRSGNGSSYGNIIVKLKGKNNQEYVVGNLNNLAVFYPYAKRNVRIALNLPEKVKLSGVLNVQYVEQGSDGKIEKVLSENSFMVK